MARNNKRFLTFFTVICLQIFIVLSPDWLKINGISPCWPVILLVSFSLMNPPWRSFIAAALLGIFFDSFIVSNGSYLPSLLLLSLIGSQFGLHNKKIELLFNVGLIAMLGTGIVGLSIWAQKIILHSNLRNNWFHSWSLYVLISEIILTGLVSPFFTSWLLSAFKKN